MKVVKTGRLILRISLVVMALAVLPGLCSAKEDDKNRPARSISMAAEYPGVAVSSQEDVSMDLIFHNKGRTDETEKVWVSDLPTG